MKLKPNAIKYSSFIYNKRRQNHSDLKSITDRNLGEEPGILFEIMPESMHL